jgi:elongation factor P
VAPEVTYDDVQLSSRPMSLLYVEKGSAHVMDGESYEQSELPTALFDRPQFLVEGVDVTVDFYNGDSAVRGRLPAFVTLRLKEVAAVAPKADGAMVKPAITDGGLRIMVPAHVSAGDSIVVRTEDGAFVKRAQAE